MWVRGVGQGLGRGKGWADRTDAADGCAGWLAAECGRPVVLQNMDSPRAGLWLSSSAVRRGAVFKGYSKSRLRKLSIPPCSLLTAGLSMLRTALTATLSPVGSRSHSYTWRVQTRKTPSHLCPPLSNHFAHEVPLVLRVACVWRRNMALA